MAGTDYEFPAAGHRRRPLRDRAAGRAAGDRQPAGDARVHAHQRRQQRQLLLDDGGRGAGGEDVRPAAARDDRGRPRAALARACATRSPPAVCRPTPSARWTFAAFRPRWRSAIGSKTPRPIRFSSATGRCRWQTMAMRNGLDPEQEQQLIGRQGTTGAVPSGRF